MPACFSLTRRSAIDKGPVNLQQIDAEICEHFQVPCDAEHWCNNWYNYIGFMLAIGKSWKWLYDDMLGECLSQPYASPGFKHWSFMLDILCFLEKEFTSDAWREFK